MRDVCAVVLSGARQWLLITSVLSMAAAAAGQEIVVPLTLETNTSTLGLTLSLLGAADSDTQHLGGFLKMGVDCRTPLRALAVRDFSFRALGTFQFSLRAGEFTAGVTNLEAIHSQPNNSDPLVPTVPGASGAVVSNSIPSNLRGAGAYTSSGFTCVALQTFGLACQGSVNLSEANTSANGTLLGILSITNHVMRFSGTLEFAEIAVAAGATIGGSAVVNASGPILPCLELKVVDSSQGSLLAKWSSAFPEFHLQRTRSLSSPVVWEAVSEPATLSEDKQSWQVPIQRDGEAAFYRLGL